MLLPIIKFFFTNVTKELKQVCLHCLLVPQYPLFLKCGHLTCLPCLREYRKYKFMFEKIFPCLICRQSCRRDEIYSYTVVKNKRPNSRSMRMLKQTKVYLHLRWMWEVLSIRNNTPSRDV